MSAFASRKEVEEFFDEMDRDFDGRLSFSEFMGEETPLEKLFKSMDKDGDGTVTKEVNKHLLEGSVLKLDLSIPECSLINLAMGSLTCSKAFKLSK